ncbi:MAG: 30S ribosomal protein S5 [Candidatus Yanofskybacteria bacterium]|nr:30S ribosomal protein S5 [Candidatus Yanofskybacteria bacterium]
MDNPKNNFFRQPNQSGKSGNSGERKQSFRREGGFNSDKKPEYEQKVLDIARVTRVTKGGKRFSFRTTVAIGDGKGKIGLGTAKGKDVAQSIQKAFNKAKKNMMIVPLMGGTIPYHVEAKYSSAKVILKPSKSGVKAGGPVRVVAKLAGITSLTGKLISRTNNKINIAKATISALQKLRIK